MEINFLAQGDITIKVEWTDQEFAKMTPDEILRRLNAGELFATAQNGGHIMAMEGDHLREVGNVVNVDNNLEYTDFSEN